MQEQTCQNAELEMVVSARDKATEAYSGVVSTPRNEPDAFKRQCFRDGWDAAIAAMPDTKALEMADEQTVERVAAALWEHNFPEYPQPKNDTDMGAMFYGMARAAIAAMPEREVTVQEAALVLLDANDDDRARVYKACEKTCKVYKFNSVLRDIAGDKP